MTNNYHGMFCNYTINQRLPYLKCNFRLVCNRFWYFWNVLGWKVHDLATYNDRWGKKVFLQLLDCPKRDAKGQWHVCSSWDNQAALESSTRPCCLSRCCSPESKRGGKNQPMVQACRMSSPLATSTLWLLQHSSLFKSFQGVDVWEGLSWEEESEHLLWKLEEHFCQLTQHLPVPISSASAAADR